MSNSSVYPTPINAFKQSKRSVLSVIVDNEPGILARIVGLFSGRGYNIEALNVTVVDVENNLSRITIETLGEERVINQIIAQLEKLVPVHSATNLANLKESYEAEICLVKIEFDNDDLAEISEKFSFFIDGITPRITLTGRNISYKLNSNNFSVRGVGPSHKTNEMTIMMQGRYINDADILNKERYVVIGRLVKDDLFGNEDAIGKFINGGGRTWKVIGVYQDDGGDNEERII